MRRAKFYARTKVTKRVKFKTKGGTKVSFKAKVPAKKRKKVVFYYSDR